MHPVKEGETLSIIAKKYYLDSEKYIDIYHANPHQIRHPHEKLTDQKIIIPKI